MNETPDLLTRAKKAMEPVEPTIYVLFDGDDVEYNSEDCFSFGRRGGTPLIPQSALTEAQAVIAELVEEVERLRKDASPEERYPIGVKELARQLDPTCWLSYSGKPKQFKQRMDARRMRSLNEASALALKEKP